MNVAAKFHAEDLVRNRETKEVGRVLSVYRLADTDDWMYEVFLPVSPDRWHRISDWREARLELSNNAVSDVVRPPS
jgi:hypothetical protein